MLCHNWALLERNDDGTANAYFCQDQGGNESPAVIDSLIFSGVMEARQRLKGNGFELLKTYPGPWMGCEPKEFIYDNRSNRSKIFSSGRYWKN